MLIQKKLIIIFAGNRFFVDHIHTDNNVLQIPATNVTTTTPLGSCHDDIQTQHNQQKIGAKNHRSCSQNTDSF
jgi:hypothetical protein